MADVDGNGTTDRSVYRNGAWYVHGRPMAFFGLGGYIPVPADDDGNGTTDGAVSKDGAWDGESEATVFFGLAGDVPLPLPRRSTGASPRDWR